MFKMHVHLNRVFFADGHTLVASLTISLSIAVTLCLSVSICLSFTLNNQSHRALTIAPLVYEWTDVTLPSVEWTVSHHQFLWIDQ